MDWKGVKMDTEKSRDTLINSIKLRLVIMYTEHDIQYFMKNHGMSTTDFTKALFLAALDLYKGTIEDDINKLSRSK